MRRILIAILLVGMLVPAVLARADGVECEEDLPLRLVLEEPTPTPLCDFEAGSTWGARMFALLWDSTTAARLDLVVTDANGTALSVRCTKAPLQALQCDVLAGNPVVGRASGGGGSGWGFAVDVLANAHADVRVGGVPLAGRAWGTFGHVTVLSMPTEPLPRGA